MSTIPMSNDRPQWEDCKVCGGDHWTKDHSDPQVARWSRAVLPSMKCVCGHWDTEHAAFTSRVRPGKTRTFCDHCDCRSWKPA